MGLKVNFSRTEAESSVRQVVPSGEYNCKVFEIETREVKPGSVHAGKPYWNVQFVIQSGTYAKNRLLSNIMLFAGKDGTLSSLAQFLRALGYEVSEGEFELPDPNELIGKDINVVGTKRLAGFDKKANRELPDRFEIRGYKKSSVVSQTGNDSSVLP